MEGVSIFGSRSEFGGDFLQAHRNPVGETAGLEACGDLEIILFHDVVVSGDRRLAGIGLRMGQVEFIALLFKPGTGIPRCRIA